MRTEAITYDVGKVHLHLGLRQAALVENAKEVALCAVLIEKAELPVLVTDAKRRKHITTHGAVQMDESDDVGVLQVLAQRSLGHQVFVLELQKPLLGDHDSPAILKWRMILSDRPLELGELNA
jgi:hypothetical protein